MAHFILMKKLYKVLFCPYDKSELGLIEFRSTVLYKFFMWVVALNESRQNLGKAIEDRT